MIQVIISTNVERIRPERGIDEHETIKSVLDEHNVNYAVGMVSIDGATLKPGDINKTFADMGVTDRCYLSVITKADNAAEDSEPVPVVQPLAVKAVVAGAVLTIKSTMKPDEIRLIAQYRPKALSIFETEDGKKVPAFSVGMAKAGDGSIGVHGVSYGTRASADGKAMVVIQIPEAVEDVAAWAADLIGVSILKLNEIEAGLPAVLAEIKGEQDKVKAAITML